MLCLRLPQTSGYPARQIDEIDYEQVPESDEKVACFVFTGSIGRQGIETMHRHGERRYVYARTFTRRKARHVSGDRFSARVKNKV